MSSDEKPVITAVLGPTNTGKTHLAVERLCAHSSGIMGFPLRLLAREVYDRVVAIKGPKAVGLITGEEKILPPGARWLLCTAESMPMDRDVSFVALDEAQLGIDPERGHVFTDRMLRVRGRDETMILGSESLRPMVRSLLPDAEIINRPRFSNLSYAGPKKLSRLPPRSAIVAFSADQVYAVAEALRRTRGGAAVVMGALSPRTRNAQVAMFQSGEVDYLVATDAIGMGLNLDVGHVAFAALSKFDGKRQRRLMVPEIAQIAGRAGRHQRDGTFGVLADADGTNGFSDDEIDRIENHRFKPIDHLFWRNSDLDFTSIPALLDRLEELPDQPGLRPAPEAVDIAVLKALAARPDVIERTTSNLMVKRLWSACGLPDFRKLGPEHHARLVATVFGHLSSGNGFIPPDWIAREVSRMDSVAGDVDTLAARISAARTWAYAAHRADWLADPAHWAGRTQELEEKLSDALHRKLTERFVDRRTSLLMRSMRDDPDALDVSVTESGAVLVEDEPIGQLDAFRFHVDPAARLGERKRLLAAAERRLPRELARRAQQFAAVPDQAIRLETDPGSTPILSWNGKKLATFAPGKLLLTPRIATDATIRDLPPVDRALVEKRLGDWLEQQLRQRLLPLLRIAAMAENAATPPPMRAVLARLVEAGGLLPRHQADEALEALDGAARHRLKQTGIIIGTLDVFHPALLKPEAIRWRIALQSVRTAAPLPFLPMPGLGLLDRPSAALGTGAAQAGYRRFGHQMLRIDLVERIAHKAHDARGKARDFIPDAALATSLGVGEATLALILRALGFAPVGTQDAQVWRWRGRQRQRVLPQPQGHAFAALAALKTGN